jgi:hypothetical protein
MMMDKFIKNVSNAQDLEKLNLKATAINVGLELSP